MPHLADLLQERSTQDTMVSSNLFGMKKRILDTVREEVGKLKNEITQELRRILEEKIGEEGLMTLQGERGHTPIRGVDYLTPKEMRLLKKELQGRSGKHGAPGLPGKDGITEVIYRDGSPDTPEQIAEKINSLQEKIDVKSIKGLVQLIQNLKRAIQEKKHGGDIGGGGDSVRYYDLSSLLDGSTKTFTVPVHLTGKSLLFGTQFPIIYRPTVDFTETRTTITLTDAVGAPQANQSLILYYVRG